MLYMVIENFKNRNAQAVYQRYWEKGRMAPEGLKYVASWTETNCGRCFQIMECSDPELLKIWAANWADLIDFEFTPVVTGQEMSEIMARELSRS